MTQLLLIGFGASAILAIDRLLDGERAFAAIYAICAAMMVPQAFHLFD